ncbi:hypothetical protein [Propylenella binzhouense]|uniref:Uncharacterized protein n=1 Tax=Propylenella binzhouense TaxID=2555902 RepID=A0A964T1F6_9HYPH|nr:hypothetical protein [Propylenella binzhouense]MYZ46247.1 hypothetical protein [Propylenella binzhouense]
MTGCPRLLLLDEPSLRLAPVIVRTPCEKLAEVNEAGMTILPWRRTSRPRSTSPTADTCWRTAASSWRGRAATLLADDRLRSAYLAH